MKADKLKLSWYALHTKSRHENVVTQALNRKSIEAFLPIINVRSKRRDRKKINQVPLFPGYLFVRTNLDPREHLEIMKTPGSIRLVGIGGPVPVSQESIESLQIMVAANSKIITGTRFRKGDKVIVTSGAFAGVTGFFSRYRGADRVVVNIGALGQFASVEVDEKDVELMPGE
ncbi:UpxY family transcription antiterminator [Desulfococcaceae bacterium HSG8]|nr:UpxY family transcription antiterminator [Desulfococcaceae bacterium HSG8]